MAWPAAQRWLGAKTVTAAPQRAWRKGWHLIGPWFMVASLFSTWSLIGFGRTSSLTSSLCSEYLNRCQAPRSGRAMKEQKSVGLIAEETVLREPHGGGLNGHIERERNPLTQCQGVGRSFPGRWLFLALAKECHSRASQEAFRHQKCSARIPGLPFSPVSHPLGGKQILPVTALRSGRGTVFIVKPGMQKHVPVLVPQRHAQSIVAIATLP